jgi:hypothetical protein
MQLSFFVAHALYHGTQNTPSHLNYESSQLAALFAAMFPGGSSSRPSRIMPNLPSIGETLTGQGKYVSQVS